MFDGKEYPVTLSPVADRVSLRRLDDQTVQQTLKAGERVVSVREALRYRRWQDIDDGNPAR
jgi:hypothetical protein